jgi:hypothetical protein
MALKPLANLNIVHAFQVIRLRLQKVFHLRELDSTLNSQNENAPFLPPSRLPIVYS